MNIESSKINWFQTEVLNWFESNGRMFLWRKKSASNYLKIISEVLLQRTKAATVAKYLPIFIAKYPSWRRLGNATQNDLEQILQPLGLQKQRASRLHKLAQEMKRRNGRFPSNRSEVEDMSMMGQYITNAYELFILKKPSPLLDVNMARVLERYFGERKLSDIRYDPYLQALSNSVVNHKEYVKINWAILDLGALICSKRKPKCGNCFLIKSCKFFLNQPH